MSCGSIRGPMGFTGPQGAQGAHGGPQGSQGPQGIQGADGPQGNQGSVGPQGDAGPQGVQGSQGIQGAVGSQGPQGDAGPQGIQGSQGIQGAVGSQGPQGDAGPQGSQGPQGIQGSQGPQGSQGSQGDIGPQGVQGALGIQGNTGSQGVAGVTCTHSDTGPILTLAFTGAADLQRPAYIQIIGTTLWQINFGAGVPGLKAWDISAPLAPVLVSNTPTVALGYQSEGFEVRGTFGFMPDTAPTSRISAWDLSVPAAPVYLGFLPFGAGTQAFDLTLNGPKNLAVVADAGAGAGMHIVDVTTPAAMVLVVNFGTVGAAYASAAWVGNYIYATNYVSDIFEIWDATVPAVPVLVGALPVPGGGLRRVRVRGTVAYLACRSLNQIRLIDVSTPANPFTISRLSVGGQGDDVTPFINAAGTLNYQGTIAGSVTDPGVLYVLNVADPFCPFIQQELSVKTGVNNQGWLGYLNATETVLYVSNRNGGQLLAYSVAAGANIVPTRKQPIMARAVVASAAVTFDLAQPSDWLVTVDATATSFTEFLPDARSVSGQTFKIVRRDATANTLTVRSAVTGQNVGTAATALLAGAGSALSATSDGLQYWLV